MRVPFLVGCGHIRSYSVGLEDSLVDNITGKSLYLPKNEFNKWDVKQKLLLNFAPVAAVFHRDSTETDIFGPENRKTCLQTAGCIFDNPWE